MPTGYTAHLMEHGEDLRAFALRCARNFGAGYKTMLQAARDLAEAGFRAAMDERLP